jgi:hypothetical protein
MLILGGLRRLNEKNDHHKAKLYTNYLVSFVSFVSFVSLAQNFSKNEIFSRMMLFL